MFDSINRFYKISNYGIINYNNMFNFFLNIISPYTPDDRKLFIKNMRLNLGLGITNQFHVYISKKIPTSDILKSF